MRPCAKSGLLFALVCLAATFGAWAQEKQESRNGGNRGTHDDPGRQQKPLESRPLTSGESLAILGAALDSRRHAVPHPDCSHFVHELYGRAGFAYEYASSADLYAGIEEFRRVESPQAGDLIVWRGHSGIVVSPLQHSFFSLLRSGPGVDSYDAPYWKRRGRPRFFRYVKPAPDAANSTPIRLLR